MACIKICNYPFDVCDVIISCIGLLLTAAGVIINQILTYVWRDTDNSPTNYKDHIGRIFCLDLVFGIAVVIIIFIELIHAACRCCKHTPDNIAQADDNIAPDGSGNTAEL